MIFQTLDPTLHNSICAKPDIKLACGFSADDIPDFSNCTDREDIKLLTNGVDAAAFFFGHSMAVWEAHCAFDLTCRGKRAIEAWEGCFEWMWTNSTAQTITAAPMISNKPACWMARRMRMTFECERDGKAWFHIHR
jgi:hypothetical protein